MSRLKLAAVAACLMSVAPIVVTQVNAANWDGFYVGISAGGAWGGGDVRYFPPALPPGPFAYDMSGAVYGGHVGYNWQTPTGWVFGIEGSLRASNADGTGNCNVGNGDTCEFELKQLTVINGRVGRVIGAAGDVLLFATAGYASASMDMTRHVSPASLNPNPSYGTFDHSGYELGAGVEYALAPHWTIGGEYQYVDLGDNDTRVVRNDGASARLNNDPNGLSIVQARLSYSF